ncbi:MAG: Asp-tRNA(Asn)/Glu-tRNA(Gln) amidotransferase subunit GatA [Gammaproteobacteria bacterium]|nr:Asp-tRNA(Asn)/Glu-tRNA(Gln) amidotransferase subunit GatA [Gammaproteobacteria bacterium]
MLHQRTLGQLADGLREGEFSSEELTHVFLARIASDDRLNAFITVDEERALTQARAADARRAAGDAGALTGVPIAHKDIFCTRGLRTTCGSRMLENFVPPYDATVVQRLESQGVITLGKTNMDEFAMGSSNETSYFGPVRNPWAMDCVPGGSSGGSAAAVAAGLAPAATGTDTGGSIRQPAAFTGLTGVKPSYGRASRYGMIAFASSLDQAGTLTRDIYDAALLLDGLCGFDPRDSTSLELPLPPLVSGLEQDLRGIRIGVPKEYFGEGLDDAVASAVREALAVFETRGASIREVSLPNSALAVPCYYVIGPAEASSNLSRYDGVRFGHRADSYTDLVDLYQKSRSEGFGDEVKRRIMIGTYTLSAGYYDAYYLKAQQLRRLIADDYARVFEECDLVAGPTTPTTAFALGAKVDDPIAMYLNDLYTIPANLAGLPALSVPCGLDPSGKPIGLHLVGGYLDESRLLAAAHGFQQSSDWHRSRPAERT